jgi:hypothetical protein
MVEEKAVEFEQNSRTYIWNSEGIENKVMIVQGTDFRLMQKRDEEWFRFGSYSMPGYKLYACLLRYFSEISDYPELEQITNLNGIHARETSSDNVNLRNLIKFYLNPKLPYYEDDKIKLESLRELEIGGTTSIRFLGYRKEDKFVISEFSEKGTEIVLVQGDEERLYGNAKDVILLDKGDALNVLKGIYYFSKNNQALKEMYNTGSTL